MFRQDDGTRRPVIAVVGSGTCSNEVASAAYEIGRLIAENGGVVVTGGMTGVMEAASRGAHDAGGLVLGILPGIDASEANEAVDVAIPTGMGQLRNGLVVSAGEAVIAVAGEWGTFSEIGFALKTGKPVIGWNTWEPVRAGTYVGGIVAARSPEDAVREALELAAHA
jgi:uncharacterized protein (TIGR00725 family)